MWCGFRSTVAVALGTVFKLEDNNQRNQANATNLNQKQRTKDPVTLK